MEKNRKRKKETDKERGNETSNAKEGEEKGYSQVLLVSFADDVLLFN